MNEPTNVNVALGRSASHVAAGQDRDGEQRGLGIQSIDFKVTHQDSQDLFILELAFHAKGGPPRHLHYEEDEWIYVLAGEFVFEVGPEGSAQRLRLTASDSLLILRRVPHVWAFVGQDSGKFLAVVTPAGKLEAFFRDLGKANVPAPQNPELWHAYGAELLGPPLPVES